MTAAAPTVLVEGDSAWIVIIAVSAVTLVSVLLFRRLITRPGGLASGLLLSLPLVLPLVAALAYDHAILPVLAVLQPADPALFSSGNSLVHLLWVPTRGSFIPYTLSDAAGQWMLWVGLSVSSVMLLRRAIGTLLVRRLIVKSRPLNAEAEADIRMMVERLAITFGMRRVPRVLVLPEGTSGAFAVGLRRARVLLSRDLIDGLERCELEGIIAHELAHIHAHDIGVTSAAGFLRDLVAWNPVAHIAYRKMMRDREIEADRSAASLTGDPLAVASGLVKACVMRRKVGARRHRFALAFADGGRVKHRVRHLLALADGGAIHGSGRSVLPYMMAALAVAALGLQTGARIAAEGDGAFLIRWGTDAQPRYWSPPVKTFAPARDDSDARWLKRAKQLRAEKTQFDGLRRKEMPRYVKQLNKMWQKAGLVHELHQWRVRALSGPWGGFQVYRLEVMVPGAA